MFIGARYYCTMADYEFQLTEGSQVTVHSGGARSDAEARIEAIQFLSEILRDVSHTEACDVAVAVVKDGQILCQATASLSACGK